MGFFLKYEAPNFFMMFLLLIAAYYAFKKAFNEYNIQSVLYGGLGLFLLYGAHYYFKEALDPLH